jgi:hypothetical protein
MIIIMVENTLKLKTYTCKNQDYNGKPCKNEFASKKDPKATLIKNRPRCMRCGKRV